MNFALTVRLDLLDKVTGKIYGPKTDRVTGGGNHIISKCN